MNILIVAFHQVYPFETGASIAQFGMIEYLSDLCNISLLLPEESSITDQEFTELKQLLPKVKIYAVDNQDKSNKKTRTNDISSKALNFVSAFKRKVKLFLKSLLKFSQSYSSSNLKNVPEVNVWEADFVTMYSSWNPYYIHSKEYVEKLNEIILQDEIDIVQLEYVDNLNLVTALPPHIKKVFVEHECIFLRIKSHIEARQLKSVFADYVMNFYKNVEISLLNKVDGVLTFNHLEYEILKNSLEDKNNKIEVFVSPFPVLERDFKEIDREKFVKPNKLIFVGADHHYPNQEAVKWFLEETAVEIFRKFGLKFYVVGKWKPDTVKQYNNHPSQVQFMGFIEDIYEFSKDSISIAPVRIGGGLRTKILLAMAQGIPVISTKFALEGINAKHLESVMIADDKDSFCWAIEYLLADLERTFMLCQNAQCIIREGYSQSLASEVRYNFYQRVLKSR
ncbi:glycosyltransferase [Scytonema hofmannii FACHB-248]|uniref:Glycosyltransferase n=1 Tax=Scytonema hofmannii FACHB-248 TaxID=1842502 RepID=A0ABR8GQC1_9CYAN|nr:MULTISPECIES: glycosyltransferase family 4 protein [Nostocales]MBD2605363.1 glycosyltransferase [Scytonema hofmannii FACHB-248]